MGRLHQSRRIYLPLLAALFFFSFLLFIQTKDELLLDLDTVLDEPSIVDPSELALESVKLLDEDTIPALLLPVVPISPSKSTALEYNQGVLLYNLTFPKVTINRIDNALIVETHLLQEYLSRAIFWSHSSSEIRSTNFAEIDGSFICQTNYALLAFMTGNATHEPRWETVHEFLLSSTAFAQLAYIELFKADLPLAVQKLTLTSADPMILEYEPLLFPWLKPSIRHLYDGFSGRGIVILVSNKLFVHVLLLVRTLRDILGCMLPIEVIYANHNDFKPAYRRALVGLDAGVSLIDLSERVDSSRLNGVNGAWFKPFAILMREVIYLDPHVLFMVDPSTLFENDNYKTFGQLFYKDRMKKEFPFASDTLLDTALWNETTAHELDSSVMLYNKGQPSSFFALLTVCKIFNSKAIDCQGNLNRKPMQDQMSRLIGDHDSHWVAFELLAMPYQFESGYGGSVGYSQAPGVICGPVSHSLNDNLLFFSGGLDVVVGRDGDKEDRMLLNFEYYSSDDETMTGMWEFTENGTVPCWKAVSPKRQIKELDVDEIAMFEKYVAYYNEIKKGTVSPLLPVIIELNLP